MNSPRQFYLEGFRAGASRFRRGAPAAPAADAATATLPSDAPAPTWEEHVKRELAPLDAGARLAACAQADEPPTDADAFRFRWFGLFYQGPARDAFTARLRLPGGRVLGTQWLALAGIVQDVAAGYVEFNPLGGLDLPGVSVRAVVEVLRRVEAVGLSTRGTGGDCVQAVRGGGREHLTLVDALELALAGDRRFADLPGPCEVVLHAHSLPTDGLERLSFRTDPPAAAGATWRLTLPGGGDLGIAVPAADAVPLCLALLRLWTRGADRTTRERATLASFVDALGNAGVVEALARELGRRLPVAGPRAAGDEAAAEASAGVAVAGGRLLSGQLEALARLAAEHHVTAVHVTAPGVLAAGDAPATTAFAAELRRIVAP